MTFAKSCFAIVLCGSICVGASAADPTVATAAPDSASPEAAPTESQLHARQLIDAMAKYTAALQRFSVTVHAGFDAVQSDGQKIQFLENREMKIERPNHLRMTEHHTDGTGNDIIFDGTKITIWSGQDAVFAQADQPDAIDDSLIYFLRDLRMRLPLAPLFMSALPAQLDGRIVSIDYVESTRATGEPTDQVAARMNTGVDVQVWIAQGDRPLPQRVVLTYRDAPGAPQFWAEFSDWNQKPKFDAKTFVFDAPQHARQIAFAVQLPLIVEQPTIAQPAGDHP